MAIHPGDILAGYRVTRLLGRGGMGEVWGATRDATPSGARRDVAIKVLLARAALKPDLVRRFEREAKIASAIKSPYVCQLLEVAAAADGAHLLVFEHLSGESLADRLKREQYLPFSEVGPIVDDVLQGLAAAHEAGVVHRDLKPGNIFLVDHDGAGSDDGSSSGGGPPVTMGGALPYPPERRERAKILDFGISKLTRVEPGEKEPTLTAFDATLGSFAYMAPEQVRGAARVDERADIYAVAAVAFRALSGRLPFEGNTAAVLVAMKLERSAPTLAQTTGEQWPAGVERFLERALERQRDLRFATATEALEAWRSIQLSAITRRPAAPRMEPVPAPRLPPIPKARPSQAATPRSTKTPAKPVVTVYAPSPELAAAPPVPPPPRPPLPSYEIVEDSPTEVDGPPTMTYDGPLDGPLEGDSEAPDDGGSSPRPPPRALDEPGGMGAEPGSPGEPPSWTGRRSTERR